MTYAEYLDENCDINNGSYALKSISKADVVETGKCYQNVCCSLHSHTPYQTLSSLCCYLILTPFNPTLPYLALPYPTVPCPTLPYPTPSFRTLPCRALLRLLGQLRHVIDERKLLAVMNSRFVLKLFGKYLTHTQPSYFYVVIIV